MQYAVAAKSPGEAEFDPVLCSARRTLYRFASWTLSDPRGGSRNQLALESTAQLVSAAAAVVRDEPSADANSLARGEFPLADLDPAPVLALLPATAETANAAYEQTFGLLVSSNCPPYETEYINSKFTFQRSHGLADVAGFYRAFGLEPSATHPERQDHLVLELEFMTLLLGLEQAAMESDHPSRMEHRSICAAAGRKFLEEHLVWWVPTFARLMSRQDPDGFYDAVSRLLAALVTAERSMAGLPTPSTQVAPSTVERPEECSGCLLNPE